MPKTRNAFAFRDFDGARILQRPFFKEFRGDNDKRPLKRPNFKKFREQYIDVSKSDAEILATLAVTDSDELAELEKKNSILREISGGLSDLYDMIQKRHADYRNGRLENYRRAVMKKITSLNETAATPFQARIAREKDLLGFYTSKVLPSFTDLIAYVAVLLAQSEKFLQAAYRRRFGERLKAARERAGLTQKDLAKKLNLTAAGYAFYERGERELTILALTRLAQVFKVSTDILLGLK